MARATWKGVTLAESDAGIVIEGNYYFPPASVNREHLRESTSHTSCPWKGTGSYFDVVVHGATNQDAAWYYTSPSPAAEKIQGYIAFWRGISIER